MMMFDSGTTVAHGPWAHTHCEAAPGSNRAVYAVRNRRVSPLACPLTPLPLAVTCHVREPCHCHATRGGPAAVVVLVRCGYAYLIP